VESDPLLGLWHVGTTNSFFAVPYLARDSRNLEPYSYVAGNPLSLSDKKGLGFFWLIDCAECFYYKSKVQDYQKQCRDEFKQCVEADPEIGDIQFMDRYKAAEIDDAIWNCTMKKAGDVWNTMVDKCGECGLSNPIAPRRP
jgi:hypothetical protein